MCVCVRFKAKKKAAAAAAAAEAEYERLRRRAPLRCAPGGGWDLLEFFGRGGWDEEGLAEAHYQLDLDEAYGEEEEVFPGFDGDGMEEGFSRPPPDAYSDIMQSMLFDSRDEDMFVDPAGWACGRGSRGLDRGVSAPVCGNIVKL